MSGKRPNNSDGKPTAASTAFYVYCIAETTTAKSIGMESTPSPIEDNSGIEIIECDGLSAVVSSVPLSLYGEESLSENLTDAAWLAPRAMRHEQVVEYFAKRTSVVPLRFGTVYLDRKRIQKMILENHHELRAIIDRLRGREEWGVNVYFDRAELLKSITVVSPRLRELAAQAENAAPGQSYLLRKKIDALRVDEVRSEINRLIDETENRLRLVCDDLQRLRVLKVESTEHGELKAKFALLIQRSKYEEFHADVERWATEKQSAGMRLELTGPWPAYNFTGDSTSDQN